MKKIVTISILGTVLILGAAAFLFLSPFGGSAKPGELVGSWSGGQGAQLILREDGSLTAVKVPTHFSVVDESPLDPFTGQGTWRLEKKLALDDQQIDVTLDEGDGFTAGIRLKVMGKGDRDGIYIPISEDSPKKFVFKKSA
ncbi:hypothetical protein [Streptomyces blastmyceticus]|uniref:Secreted protein n=1 Tax=Streptomyces blastmyceticus TaxID=68180 RepID=A0ABP3HNS9_9ACTN